MGWIIHGSESSKDERKLQTLFITCLVIKQSVGSFESIVSSVFKKRVIKDESPSELAQFFMA